MLPWQRIREDLQRGLEHFRKGSLTAPGVAAQEMNILKLSLELRKLDEHLGELYGEVGRRVYDKLTTRDLPFEAKDPEMGILLGEIRKQMSLREKTRAELEELRRGEPDEPLLEL